MRERFGFLSETGRAGPLGRGESAPGCGNETEGPGTLTWPASHSTANVKSYTAKAEGESRKHSNENSINSRNLRDQV